MRVFNSLVLWLLLACSLAAQSPQDVGIEISQVTRIVAESPVLVEQKQGVSIFSREFSPKFSKGILIKAQEESNLLIRFQRLNEFPRVADRLQEGLYFVEGKPGETVYVEVISFSAESGFRFYGETFVIDEIPFCGEPDDPEVPDDPDLPPPPEDIEIVDQAFYNAIKKSVEAIPEAQKFLFDKVANNFESVARKAISGEIRNNRELWTEISNFNQETITQPNLRFWDSFGVTLQVEINTRIRDNKIEDSAKGRAPYLLMVAKALREAQ